MDKFKVGDIVQLLSGGPKMTVVSISDNKRSYTCKWFAGAKLDDGYFPEEALDAPKDPKPEKK